MRIRMCSRALGIRFALLVFLTLCIRLAAEMPQEHWVEETELRLKPGSTQYYDLCRVGSNVYAVADTRVDVFTNKWWDGRTLISGSGTGEGKFNAARRISSDGQYLYVADTGNSRVQVFNQDGSFVRQWAASASDMEVDGDFLFGYVASNAQIRVYSKTGELVRAWGEYGSAAGQIYTVIGKSVYGGIVAICESGVNRVQLFTSSGQYIRSWGLNYEPRDLFIDNSYVYVLKHDKFGYRQLEIFNILGNSICNMTIGYADAYTVNKSWGYVSFAFVCAFNGFVYVSAADAYGVKWLTNYRQYARTLGERDLNMFPQGRVVSCSQRSGMGILDVAYTVHDEGPLVNVYAGAFLGTSGALSLSNYVPVRTLVDGSATNLGEKISVNVTHQFSWDLAADGVSGRITSYGDIRVAIFCNDGRGLLDLHFLHLPEDDVGDALVINRVGIQQSDLLPLWYWQLAKGDPSIVLTNGVVSGVSGDFAGQVLAQSTNTTQAGRSYLFGIMGLREATQAELQRAREGASPGTVYKWPTRRIPPSGSTVNEYNFVTSPTNGWWVVPL